MKVEVRNIPIRLNSIKFKDYLHCPSCSYCNRRHQFVFVLSPYNDHVVGLYIVDKKNGSGVCDYYSLNFKKSLFAKQFLLLLLRSDIDFIRRITNCKCFINVPL